MSAFTGALGSLWVEVGAKISDFEAGMAKVGKTIDSTLKDAQDKFRGFEQLGATMAGIGSSLTTALTLPLVGIGIAAAKMQGDFEHAMNKVSALGDITGKDLQMLEAQAVELGQKTQFSGTQAAEGMATLAASGQSAQQIFSTMPGVLNLAAAGELSIAQAATIATDAISQFGLSVSDSARVADVLAKAAASGKDSVQGVGVALGYVGGSAHAAGLSLEETTAALTLLADSGLRGSQAGTALNAILIRLVKPTKQAAQALGELGISTVDAQGHLLPLSSILDQLKDKHLGLADAAKIAGVEHAAALSNLAKAGGTALTSLTTQFQNASGEADRMAKTINQGIGGSLERMKGSIETAGQSIGKILEPAIISISGFIEGAANRLSDFSKWFSDLPDPIKNTAGAIVLFGTAIGPVLLVLGTLIGSVGVLGSALATITAAGGISGVVAGFGTLVGTSSLLAPALIAVAGAVSLIQFKQIADEATSLWEALTTTSGTAATSKGIFDQLKDSLFGLSTEGGNAGASLDSTSKALATTQPLTKDTVTQVSLLSGVLAEVNGFLSNFSYILSNVKWTDFLTPIGLVRNALANLTEGIKTVRGVFPEMEKAGTDALAKLQDANRTSMRAFADHAIAAVNLGKAHATAKTEATRLASALSSTGKEAKSAKDEFKPLVDKGNELWQTADKLQAAWTKHNAAIADAKNRIAQFADFVPKTIQVTDDLDTSINKIITDSAPLGEAPPAALRKIFDAATEARQPLEDLEAAYKKLGVTSTATLQQQAREAQTAYDTIRASGIASASDLETAWDKSQKAQIAAARSAGEEIPVEQAKALATMDDQLQAGQSRQKTAWDGFSNEVSTIVTNLAQDLAKGLFEGGGSWAEKGITALKRLGEAAVSQFIQPFASAAADLLSGALADLLGGKGFGGLSDRIKDVGGQLSGLFGKGGGATDVLGNPLGSIPGVSGGGAATGAGGAATGAAGAGVTAIAGAVGSIAGAISGVIGNFQSAHQETSLNAIEHNTRYAMMFLGERGDGGIVSATQKSTEYLGYLNASVDTIGKYLSDWLSPANTALQDIASNVRGTSARLNEISTNTFWGSQAEKDNSTILSTLRDLLSTTTATVPNIQVFVNGVQAPASSVSLKMQGVII